MGISELFWGFFIISMLQPVLRKKMQEIARRRMLAQIETMRGSRVILLVHRQETMSLLGFPVLRYIDIHEHTGKVTAFVPHYAMSGGTLIALAADEIVMSRHAVLGPVDPQLGQYPAASILRAVERKPVAEVDDSTLILADQAEMARRQLHALVTELVAERLEPGRAHELATQLASGRWTHDYPIPPEEANKLGLPVSTEIPPEVLQLMALYPQPVRRQPGVEYLPGPRRPPRTTKGE